LAHWIISQRQIRIILPNKTSNLSLHKLLLARDGTIGALIVAGRKEAGLTQEKLAEITCIHRQWLGRWERGRATPDPAAWAKLSEILSLPSQPKEI